MAGGARRVGPPLVVREQVAGPGARGLRIVGGSTATGAAPERALRTWLAGRGRRKTLTASHLAGGAVLALAIGAAGPARVSRSPRSPPRPPPAGSAGGPESRAV